MLALALIAAALVYQIPISGMITQPMAEELREAFHRAQRMNSSAILIIIDTPGGEVGSLEQILELIQNSPIPVIGYVPKGARAFSAGAFILMGSHLAGMANGTAMGAATPVSISGEGISAAERKVVNAFASRMRGLAQERGRNLTAAEDMVTQGKSYTALEAFQLGLIDIIADSTQELLEGIHGAKIRIDKADVLLETKGSIYIHNPSLRYAILSVLANPFLAAAFFGLGLVLLLTGVSYPGTYIPEVLGGILIVLSLYGMGLMGGNAVGILLLLLAAIFFIAEVLTPGMGVLTAAGVISLALGIVFLPPPPLPESGWILSQEAFHGLIMMGIGLAAGLGGFLGFALAKVIKARRARAKIGAEELLGMEGIADTDVNPEGYVKLRGELWRARVRSGSISKGQRVKVIERRGLVLIVEPLES